MKENKVDKTDIILIYIVFIGPLSIALFLYGFFPLINSDNTISTPNDIPKFVENIRIKEDTLYQPIVKKLIIMVIDALRWDFIAGSVGKVAMPITSNLIANSSACLLKTRVQAPTVTMPRIKAITTGMIPNFIDVALNFGSKPISGDSVLLQAKMYGHKLIFYGDDTWLTLFPSLFERYDGTTSFVVTDFTEVDNNVTRHLNTELYGNTDWSIMILHYLGLDHIGHIHGPFSPLVKTKLKEMDDVITKIYLKMKEWNQNNDSSLFIICGDHGMKDSGGHGGSTISETSVPFIAIGGECLQDHNHPTEIDQIDIAPTLSTILGVPIPFSNLGTVFSDTLYSLPVSKKLFALYYNSKQVLKHFQRLADYETDYAYQKYLEAIKLHNAWLSTKGNPNDMVDDIILSYNIALKGMKETLINSMIKYDFCMITIAIILLCQVLCILTGKDNYESPSTRSIIILIILNIIFWALLNYLWEFEGILLHSLKNFATIIIALFIVATLIVNCYLLASFKYFSFFVFEKTENKTGVWLLSFGTFVHAISLSGSSFVEEEHQIWYFYWVTALLSLMYNSAQKYFLESQVHRHYRQYLYAHICIKLLLLLIGHRVLRKLNSTGDKYAHLPDIAGFLTEQESKLGMTLVIVAALALLIWIGFINEHEKYKYQSLIFNIMISTCIYLRHMHNNSIIRIPLYPQTRGIYEAFTLWVLLAINVINCTFRLVLTTKYSKTMFLRNVLYFILQVWITITAMIHQPHNIILLPFQIMFSSVIYSVIKDNIELALSVFMYVWIGNVFYFYQGNSNSLATIDVAAGYVGIQSYMPFVNGSLVLINTFAAPVLSYFLLVYHVVLYRPYNVLESTIQICKIYIIWRLIPVTIYTIIISIQRHHLFVWSVFSPKLLYEAVHSAIICFVTLIILILITLQKKINSYDR